MEGQGSRFTRRQVAAGGLGLGLVASAISVNPVIADTLFGDSRSGIGGQEHRVVVHSFVFSSDPRAGLGVYGTMPG